MISVIIPTYNRAYCIEKSVRSVLNQTYTDLELLVVDDGSTDETRQVLASIQDSRLKYIFQENAGACAARNNGISHAKGAYIAFHDSDDVWLPEKLQKQYDILQKTNADIVFCKLRILENGKCQRCEPTHLSEGFVNPIVDISRISTQTLIAKRAVFDAVKFDPQMPRMQDFEWLLRAARKYSLYCLDEGLVNWTYGEDSISARFDKLMQAFFIIHQKNPRFRREFPVMSRDIAHFWCLQAEYYQKLDADIFRKAVDLAEAYAVDMKGRYKCLLLRLGLYTRLKKLLHR